MKLSAAILLGDQPMEWFLRFYDSTWRRPADLGTDVDSYGRLHDVTLDGHRCRILPVTHPCQAKRLGKSSQRWQGLHAQWASTVAAEV